MRLAHGLTATGSRSRAERQDWGPSGPSADTTCVWCMRSADPCIRRIDRASRSGPGAWAAAPCGTSPRRQLAGLVRAIPSRRDLAATRPGFASGVAAASPDRPSRANAATTSSDDSGMDWWRRRRVARACIASQPPMCPSARPTRRGPRTPEFYAGAGSSGHRSFVTRAAYVRTRTMSRRCQPSPRVPLDEPPTGVGVDAPASATTIQHDPGSGARRVPRPDRRPMTVAALTGLILRPV